MIVLEAQGLNGYDDGLNGLKIASFLKRNIKSAGKDIGAVAKVVAPLALSLIPVVGGAVGNIAGKLLTNADGSASLLGRVVEKVETISETKVGQSIVKLATPLVKNAKANLLKQSGQLMTDEQALTLATAKGTTPQQELDAFVANAQTPEIVASPAPVKKDNTVLYVGGGIAALAIGYMVFK